MRIADRAFIRCDDRLSSSNEAPPPHTLPLGPSFALALLEITALDPEAIALAAQSRLAALAPMVDTATAIAL